MLTGKASLNGGVEVEASRSSRENRDGDRKSIEGKDCIFFDGYWIRHYEPPPDTLAARKGLIDSLTRRLFHHTEGGINTPGEKLDRAREAYENETDISRKRVKGAMLAGALFNRATDIFTTVVDLAERGVHISSDNELMRACEDYFQEALTLGKQVKHYSGEEGIDELWGEPLKAFVLPVSEFYLSRYVKIAQTMRDIDAIAGALIGVFDDEPGFDGIGPLIAAFDTAARLETETMRSDPAIFEVWPEFVATGEALEGFAPSLSPQASEPQRRRARDGLRLVRDGKELVTYLAGARVPMRKSTRHFLERAQEYLDEREAVYGEAVGK
jgi:hypothetical protein